MNIDDVIIEDNEIELRCKCGKTTWMLQEDFMSLVICGRMEGLDCDYCDKPLVKVVVCPTMEA
jgi:hypothetical protein